MFTRSETELTSAVTDALLGAVCLVQAWRLAAIPTTAPWLQRVWMAVLILTAGGALLGALVHGVEFGARLRALLWRPLYLSVGVSVALVVVCAIGDWLGEPAGRRGLPWALGAGLAFVAARELLGGRFAVFLAYEGAALMVALVIYVALAADHVPGAGATAVGLVISLLAALVQLSGWRLRVIVAFDHNGLFHLVQMAGVMAISLGVHARLLG